MLKSIKYKNRIYDNNTCQYKFSYEIIDSDFVFEILADNKVDAVIKTYEIKNYSYQEIVNNLFLLNIFFIETYNYTMHEILSIQKHRFTNKSYYYDLVKYTNKMLTLI